MERITFPHSRMPLSAITLLLACSSLAVAANTTIIRFPEVLFPHNSNEPLPDSSYYFVDDERSNTMDEVITDMAAIMRDNPTVVIELTGHADGLESDQRRLSLERARRVACILTSDHRIHSERLVVTGMSAERPWITEAEIARMATKEEQERAHQLNRRVDFHIARFDWSTPVHDELAAVRFLSDPIPPKRNGSDFCDEPVTNVQPKELTDTAALLDESDTALIAVVEAIVPSTEGPSFHSEDLAPMIVPNPIMNDELSLVWLPATAQGLSIRVMALDGRSVSERLITRVEQGARLGLTVPISLASGAYILRIGTGTQAWSLRFVKP